jgi:hypothetical protein
MLNARKAALRNAKGSSTQPQQARQTPVLGTWDAGQAHLKRPIPSWARVRGVAEIRCRASALCVCAKQGKGAEVEPERRLRQGERQHTGPGRGGWGGCESGRWLRGRAAFAGPGLGGHREPVDLELRKSALCLGGSESGGL